MKRILASLVLASTITLSAWAEDVAVKLTDVHLCCQGCVKGVQTAVNKVSGAKATSDMDEGTISLTAPDAATAQKAVNALTDAGYYGKSSDASIKVSSETGAKDQKVQLLKIEDLHLCCGKCVKSVNEALSTVSGVTTNTATKGAKTFTISGDFNDKDAMVALQKEGLTGHIVK